MFPKPSKRKLPLKRFILALTVGILVIGLAGIRNLWFPGFVFTSEVQDFFPGDRIKNGQATGPIYFNLPKPLFRVPADAKVKISVDFLNDRNLYISTTNNRLKNFNWEPIYIKGLSDSQKIGPLFGYNIYALGSHDFGQLMGGASLTDWIYRNLPLGSQIASNDPNFYNQLFWSRSIRSTWGTGQTDVPKLSVVKDVTLLTFLNKDFKLTATKDLGSTIKISLVDEAGNETYAKTFDDDTEIVKIDKGGLPKGYYQILVTDPTKRWNSNLLNWSLNSGQAVALTTKGISELAVGSFFEPLAFFLTSNISNADYYFSTDLNFTEGVKIFRLADLATTDPVIALNSDSGQFTIKKITVEIGQ